jgi:hypothetical protein
MTGTIHGTLTITSLQGVESFLACPEPQGIAPTLMNCNDPIIESGNGTQTVDVAFGGAVTPALAVTAFGTGDMSIAGFDVLVPEPGTLALLLTAMAGLLLARKRRNSV